MGNETLGREVKCVAWKEVTVSPIWWWEWISEPHQREISKFGMWEMEVREEEVTKIVGKLKERKTIEPYGVSWHVLRECRQQMSGPIFKMRECSLNKGKAPKEWKRAESLLTNKSGNREKPHNYRAVLLTSLKCKLCGKVIKNNGWSTWRGIRYWRMDSLVFKKGDYVLPTCWGCSQE